MEIQEDFMASKDQALILKRKRTKRQRPSSPSGTVAVTSSSSSGGGGGGGEDFDSLIPSPAVSSGISRCTEEEEDMANCLILLARGGFPRRPGTDARADKFISRRFVETAANTGGKSGLYVYECKTCNRTFPSFQALGGHRASHKKPKGTAEEKKSPITVPSQVIDREVELEKQFEKIDHLLNDKNKTKIHECSICGSEFSSGQALGGHMRRHRTAPPTTGRNILELDLNLPAPEDDHRDSSFELLADRQRDLIFTAPALVDCHY